jgi:hypothetical protein
MPDFIGFLRCDRINAEKLAGPKAHEAAISTPA